MRESKEQKSPQGGQDPDLGVGRAFGLGVDPDPRTGRGAEDGDSERGAEAARAGGEDGQGQGATARRGTRFQCSLGYEWRRSGPGDLWGALSRVSAVAAAASPPADLLGKVRASQVPDCFEAALERFRDEGREEVGQRHLILSPEEVLEGLGSTASGPGSAASFPMVIRLDALEPASAQARRVVRELLAQRAVVVISDPELPLVAESIVDWIVGGWPDAPLELLHDDGLDCARAAASRADLGLQFVAPEWAFESQLIALRRTRAALEEERNESAAAEAAGGLAVEGAMGAPEEQADPEPSGGHFGSGVVGAPLPPVELDAAPPEPMRVSGDHVPAEAAQLIVERAFGPGVLGGHATTAIGCAVVARSIFSAVTGSLLERLDAVEEDVRYDPPFWRMGPDGSPGFLGAARRLGLDEGATLIFERRAADERGDPYGQVFTNGEARMRIARDARALGSLVLMRGDEHQDA